MDFSNNEYQSVQEHTSKGFSCDWEQNDSPVLGAVWILSLGFLQDDDVYTTEIIWKFALLPPKDK